MICMFMETMSMMLLEHSGGIYHPPKSRFFVQDNRDPKVFVRCSMLLSTFNHSIYLFPHDFSRLWICLPAVLIAVNDSSPCIGQR